MASFSFVTFQFHANRPLIPPEHTRQRTVPRCPPGIQRQVTPKGACRCHLAEPSRCQANSLVEQLLVAVIRDRGAVAERGPRRTCCGVVKTESDSFDSSQITVLPCVRGPGERTRLQGQALQEVGPRAQAKWLACRPARSSAARGAFQCAPSRNSTTLTVSTRTSKSRNNELFFT
jgi:hypothetical protein